MKKLIIILYTICIFISCSEKSVSDVNIPISIPEKPESGELILAKDIGNYAEYFTSTDYSVGITSIKDNPRCKECIYAFEGPNTDVVTKSSLIENQYYVSINGKDVFTPEVKSGTDASIHDMFGQKLSFKFTPKHHSIRSSSGVSQTASINAPELLSITNPVYEQLDELYPLCDYKNFIVEWNKDANNSNGVVVLVMWAGTMMFGNSYENVLVRNIDCIPDNGKAILPESIFDGIPDTALCFLILIRGDVSNVELDDDLTYQISAKTQVVLPFVLVREVV